ncbi:NAD(P)/FAD-dependent oxidoreductase [Rhodococcus triatomae]|uniref:Predicted flavoprotein CzcO associated with the cation diffusion facilitator CzcD n=1 Tax=Rhodococcus triatomae TaxID=300028 RepID=A0A1G8L4W9_9NOCA|nr:NAD(P)/FAD-dependent oxidoreductase [Rhodococcus triatomae]QNG20507.1 NAD(P)/FAD-dependent oxidoreductase [Rhodococcus triatomae]QNG23575.1 NAD(P)/FAD-dependent oxidoreductase [Rhodococcus triatomae]SDI50722.1 Predicted flavoprotein CzcO associated with the cation diffusion facilitator CzcD [Rhodococcus triatomae]
MTEDTGATEATDAGAAGTAAPEHIDVLVIGAGLSAIDAAYHVQKNFPDRSYTLLEARDSLGGTWDLFRYPGIRSDSDMYTLGFPFRPWTGEKAIADGHTILEYLRDTAAEFGIDEHIRYGHRVVRAEWSTRDSLWTIEAQRTDSGQTVRFTAGFLLCCTGYYRYDEGYTPDFPGVDRFGGTLVHPQHWPEDLDYTGKRVVVIGSGATAVTLAPSMADAASHVSILQRSPSYIISVPARDALATTLQERLPGGLGHRLARLKSTLVATALYQACQRFPTFMKGRIRDLQKRWLPDGYDIDTHFAPRYDPWDQRMCLVPNGDLFRAIRHGDVDMVTDRIATFTETGIALESGAELEADVVVSATGLNLLAFGGIELVVDGDSVELSDTMAYKGMMLSGVPNFAFVVGYTNASWTLKADLVSEYVVRLLRYMDDKGFARAVPRRDPSVDEEPFLDFAAGYVLRSVDSFPRQGSQAPWRLRMNWFRDLAALRHGSIVDAAMSFDVAPVRTEQTPHRETSATASGR